jgi:ssDNA-binding Zn-finger/Zn-ribbon topoisomerase 1
VVERKSRGRGKPFYSCSRYPDCDFIINKKPESEEELKELWAAEQAKPKREKKLSEKKLIGAKPRGGAKAKTPTKAKAANKDKS